MVGVRHVLIAVPIQMLATGGLIIEPNILTLAVSLVTTVGLVVAVMKWVEDKISNKLKTHEENVALKLLLINQQISHLREILGLKKHYEDEVHDKEKEISGG